MFGLTYSASVAGFMFARLALGLGEAGNFPAAIKVTAEWFPKRERAFATGMFNSGTNIGALVTPLVVPWITLTYGWYWAFVVTGALGFIWLLFWWTLYDAPESHQRVSAAELALHQQRSAGIADAVSWRELLGYRQAWAFAIGKFMTDPIWWLYLFWIPDFFNRNHGIDLPHDRSAAGRDLSGRGRRQHRRRLAVVVTDQARLDGERRAGKPQCSPVRVAVVPMVFASTVSNLWVAVGLIGLAAAAHQGWSANLYTLVSDTFPRQAVGVSRWIRRDGGRGRRHADREGDRQSARVHRKLRSGVHDRRVRLSDGARDCPRAGAASRSGSVAAVLIGVALAPFFFGASGAGGPTITPSRNRSTA